MNVDPKRESGGYTQAAAVLSAKTGLAISRQRVWIWWSRRSRNGFPEGWKRLTKGGGVRRFYLDEVLAWYRDNYHVHVDVTDAGHAVTETQIKVPRPRAGEPTAQAQALEESLDVTLSQL